MTHTWHTVGNIATCVGWGAVAVTWAAEAALASGRSRPPVRRDGHDAASVAAAALAFAALVTPTSWWTPLTTSSSAVALAGIVLLPPAVAFTIWSRLTLGTLWSSGPVVRDAHTLRTTGPYRVTRHPIYTGILAMVAATVLAQGAGRWVVIALGVVVALVSKARAEDRLLADQFGADHARYRKEVPLLLPR